MEEIILQAELREEVGRGKTKGLRDNGFIPTVIYGEGSKAQSIKVSSKELAHLVHQAHFENAIITVKIKGDKKEKGRSCLIKEIQYNPVHGNIVHVDFNEISLTKAIKINVPVTAIGDAPGVKLEGGSLEHVLWEVEVECLPTAIPKEIIVDVSALKLGDSIHVKDLVLAKDIKVTNDPGAIVIHVAAPIKEEVVVEEEGAEKKEPEVIKEKKEVPAEGAEGEAKEKEKEKK